MNPSISVVIPNYNGKELLQSNLPSVYLALQKAEVSDFEIIVPDDASTDSSLEFLKENYPDIRVIASQKNGGFSININRGIRAAQHALVLLLNSDVILTENYFLPLLSYFDRSDTFGVTGRIHSLDGTTLQDAGKYPQRHFGAFNSTTNFLIEEPETLSWIPTFFMSGSNVLVDRQKLMELEGFDEIFSPYYAEDVDLCLRAWKLGYRSYFETRSVCLHPNSATIGKLPSTKVRTTARRNQLILHDIHLMGFERSWFRALLQVKAVVRRFFGDQIFWEAFSQFRTLSSQIERSRARLHQLQSSKKTLGHDLRWIQNQILAVIKNTRLRRF